MKWLKRAAWLVGAAILVMAAALAGGLAYLQTSGGKTWLAATVDRALAGKARASGIGGAIPFHLKVAEVALLDPAGEWARLDSVRLDIAPWDLLRGRLIIRELSAARLAVERMPQSRSKESTALALPHLPLDVGLERMRIASIALAPPVLGEPVALTLRASARLDPGEAALNLSVERIDGERGGLEARLDFARARAWLSADLRAEEPSGLLLQRLLGRSDRLPLDLRLAGAAPLRDWHGTLTAAAGGRARLEAQLALAGGSEGMRVAIDGGLAAAPPLLPPALAPLAAPRLDFHLAGLEAADGDVLVEALRLDSGSLHLDGSGAYRKASHAIGLSLRASAPDLSRFAALLGTEADGAASLTLSASGTPERPILAVTARADRLARGGDRLDGAVAELALAPDRPLGAAGLRYAARAKGRVQGIALATRPVPPGFGDLVEWHLAADLDPATKRMAIGEFGMRDAGMALSGTGDIDGARREAAARAHLALDDLAPLGRAVGASLAGRGGFDLTLRGSGDGAGRLGLEGALDGLATGAPLRDALIGHRLALRLAASRDDIGRLVLDAASLDGARLHLDAHGGLDPARREVDGAFVLALAPPAAGAPSPLSGTLRLDGRLRGAVAAPRLEASLDGKNFTWQGRRLDALTAQLQATLGTNLSAMLAARFRSGSLAGTLDAQAALDRERGVLAIPRLRLAAGGGRLEGSLRTALGTRLTNGSIVLHLPDLAPWSPLAGMPLAGRADARLTLTAPGRQDAALALRAEGLRIGDPGPKARSLAHIAATGRISDALGRPSGRLAIEAADARAAAARIDRVKLDLRAAKPGQVAFDLDLAGDLRGPLALTGAGRLDVPRGGFELSLARLEGRLAGYPLRLERPLAVSERGRAIALSELILKLGNGSLHGSGRLEGERLAATLAAKSLPVGLIGKLAGRDDIDGALDLGGDLGGSLAQPQGRLSLELRELRLKRQVPQGAPALSLAADAALRGERIQVTGSLAIAGGQSLSFEGEVPIRVQRRPFALALARDRALSLRLHGDVRLERIADFLPLAGDRIGGDLHLDLAVGGTAAAPVASGGATLARGHYESLASGLVLDNAAFAITGERDRIVIHRLDAGDGDKGRLDGSGSVSLAGMAPATLALAARFQDFRILHRDDATARMSGAARIEGAASQPRLTATLTIDEAEIYLPDRLPPSAQPLPVTVIDSATGRVLERPSEGAGARPGMAAALDVQIAIPGRTFVRGRGLDSEWRGDLHITGTSAAPEITGALQVVHGTFAFFGKDLGLSRGTIAFSGGHTIDPSIDVLAETAAAGITAQVQASGTASDPKLALSSVPELPQDEILSRLLFGKGLGQVTPAQGLQLAAAAETLASGGPGLLDRVRSKLGFDVLSFGGESRGNALSSVPGTPGAASSGSASSGGAAGGPSVSAGKYIANGVYVGVQQGVSGQSRSTVEVEVAPNVTVDSGASLQGGNDIGLNWKLDY